MELSRITRLPDFLSPEGELPSLKEIRKLLSLEHLHISGPYDPDFKPVNGVVKGLYNGVVLTITVNGVYIKCDTKTFEGEYDFDIEQIEPGYFSWFEITHKVLFKIIYHMRVVALNQIEFLKSEGYQYYVN